MSRKTRLLATRFYQLLIQGNLTAADREFERIKQELKTTERQRDHVNTLEGTLVALRSRNIRYVFIKRIRPESIEELRKEFYEQSRNRLQADFDRGFFAAWTSYVRILGRTSESKDLLRSEENGKDEGLCRERPYDSVCW